MNLGKTVHEYIHKTTPRLLLHAMFTRSDTEHQFQVRNMKKIKIKVTFKNDKQNFADGFY